MGQKILLAEPYEILRKGLRTILEQDEQISDIYEATTSEEIRERIHCYNYDLLVIHQSLVTECKILPMNRSILLADEPDIDLFLEAYRHKVRAYLSLHVSSELLFAAIHTAKDSCLLDPVFLPWIMDHLHMHIQYVHELGHLSPREREVAWLMKDGLDRRTIAQQLHISDATLKTHIKNIAQKREEKSEGLTNLKIRRLAR